MAMPDFHLISQCFRQILDELPKFFPYIQNIGAATQGINQQFDHMERVIDELRNKAERFESEAAMLKIEVAQLHAVKTLVERGQAGLAMASAASSNNTQPVQHPVGSDSGSNVGAESESDE